MSRVAFGLKNTKLSLFFYLVLLLLTFFSRKVFIDTLGVEFMGLSSSVLNILSILNLSELGVATAIATSLYTPLHSSNRKQIEDIVSIMGYFYRLIGFVVIGMGAVLLLLLPLLYDSSGISMVWVYATFGALFVANLVPFFVSYQQVLLDADQRYYEITASTNTLVFIKVVLQIILLRFLSMGYCSWLVLEVLFAFLLGVWLLYRTQKIYPWLKSNVKRGGEIHRLYPEIFRRSKQVIPHRISNAVLNQIDNILLLLLVSLSSVTLYTNYSLIMKKCVVLVTTTFNGLTAGVGSLIAQGNIDSVKKLFWEFNALFFMVGAVGATGLYFLVNPFVELWLGDEFVLGSEIALVLSVNMFLTIIRLPLIYFTNGYALFKDMWAPCAEATINLIISIALGYKLGIVGVMLGTSVSLLFINIWKPYFFYREIFKTSVFSYWRVFLFGVMLMLGNILFIEEVICRYILLDNINFLGWIINALIVSTTSIFVLGIGMIIGFMGANDILQRFVKLVIKR